MFTIDGEIKLIDFGLSKWKSTGEVHTSSGTPYYLAPEILYGVKTSKSDIWSLGILLYCLLSGSLPFVSDSQETVYEKAQEADIHFDSKIWGSISYEAQDLINRMVDKDYHHRYNASECLGHEWFINSLSDEAKKSYYANFKDKKSIFSSFLTRCEVESSLAKMIDKHLKTKEIEDLGVRFDEISDERDRISSEEL